MGLALAGAAQSALAQSPTQAGTALTDIGLEALLDMRIETASKQSERLGSAPAFVSVITRDEIREHGLRTLGDVMRLVPGVHMSSDRNYDFINIRGFGRPSDYNTRVLLLVDGRRVNDIVYDTAAFDRSFPVDLSLIERIEFVPGPGSALYGANAFFGVLNLITRRDSKTTDAQGITAQVAIGSQSGREASLSVHRHFEQGLSLTASVAGYRSRGFDVQAPEFEMAGQPGGVVSGLDGERARKLFLALGMSGWRLTGIASERDKDVPTAPSGSVVGASGNRSTDSYSLLSLGNERRLGSNLWLNTQLSHSDYTYTGRYPYDLDGTGQPPYSHNQDEARARWWSIDLRLNSTHFAGHKLVAGVEFENSQLLRQRNIDEGAPSPNFDVSRRLRRSGIYLQDQFKLGERIELTLGLRHDNHASFGAITTPRLALVYRHSQSTSLKLLAGSAYRAPNAYELDFQALDYRPVGKLEPERITTLEAGFEHAIGRQGLLRGSMYRYRLRNLIDLHQDPVSGELSFRNLNGATATGGALEASWRWRGGARLRGSLSWQRAIDDETGSRLSNSPPILLKLDARMPLPLAGALLALDAQQVARRVSTSGVPVARAAVVNLSISSRQLVPGSVVSASVYNLLDRRILEVASPDYNLAAIPQEGRAVWLRIGKTWR